MAPHAPMKKTTSQPDWHHRSTPLEVIIKKRDGHELTEEEVIDFVTGFTNGSIPDYQAAAFMMAVNCRGMSEAVRHASASAVAHACIPSHTLPAPLLPRECLTPRRRPARHRRRQRL
jgi:hypothetical protein